MFFEEVADFEVEVWILRINYQTILNYFDNRSTNASAESFNAKVKELQACQDLCVAQGNGTGKYASKLRSSYQRLLARSVL